MPIIHKFDYLKPKNIGEALTVLAKSKNTAILAGGTDLIDLIKENVVQPEVVVDIKGLDELNQIKFENDSLFIGAGVTFSDLIESKIIKEKYPVIFEISKTVASVGIRNRATVVGNICSAVPCMDSGPLLMAYDATVQVVGQKGTRNIPAAEWFIAPRKTSLQKGELVSGISLLFPKVKHAGCWVKLGRYTGEDLAQVNLLILAMADGTFRISFGAVAPVPVRARKVEKLLNGQAITPTLIEKANQLIEEEIKPITDVRATKEYRMHMAKVMFERGLNATISRLTGKSPKYGTSVI
ncbi:MAG: xanthine dehydrogenase family protein subunit M [Ignavibacteriales bacterium]|nr:xanthine dehydrogenase family protein subunit M [Ignavibacteriales bacterium]